VKIVKLDINLAAAGAAIKKYLPDLSDIFVFAGIGSIFYGVYQIFPPAAYIVTGVLVGLIGVAGVKR
jgi:hypothetical protein